MDAEENKRLGELIFELAQGNMTALDEIFVIMGKILYAIGNQYYFQKADIEDAIHSTLLYIALNSSKFKKNENAKAWITTLHINLIKNKIKRRTNEERYLKTANNIDTGLESKNSAQYIENYAVINEIFDRLNDLEQKIVILRYWGKCTIKEIAEGLHKPKSSIGDKIQRIESKMKEFVDK